MPSRLPLAPTVASTHQQEPSQFVLVVPVVAIFSGYHFALIFVRCTSSTHLHSTTPNFAIQYFNYPHFFYFKTLSSPFVSLPPHTKPSLSLSASSSALSLFLIRNGESTPPRRSGDRAPSDERIEAISAFHHQFNPAYLDLLPFPPPPPTLTHHCPQQRR